MATYKITYKRRRLIKLGENGGEAWANVESHESVPDCYTVLGIDSNASSDEIKTAYKALALVLHKDKGGRATDEELLKEVNAAYAVLRDPDKKKAFDEAKKNEPRKSTKEPKATKDSDTRSQIFRDFMKQMESASEYKDFPSTATILEAHLEENEQTSLFALRRTFLTNLILKEIKKGKWFLESITPLFNQYEFDKEQYVLLINSINARKSERQMALVEIEDRKVFIEKLKKYIEKINQTFAAGLIFLHLGTTIDLKASINIQFNISFTDRAQFNQATNHLKSLINGFLLYEYPYNSIILDKKPDIFPKSNSMTITVTLKDHFSPYDVSRPK